MEDFVRSIMYDYKEQLPYLFYMASTMCIGTRTYQRIKGIYNSPKDFYDSSDEQLMKSGLFTNLQLERFSQSKRFINPARGLEKMVSENIFMVVIDEVRYPSQLKEIKDPPPFIFVKGMLPPTRFPLAGVVGARECTTYGANVAKRLGEVLAENKISVVSGMARGIDSIAQTAAVDSGGYSCALLGGGVDIVYPAQSRDLYERLCERGGVISEFPPGTAPLKQYFAMRNRLISGLSDIVCVVEAKEKSGTLITVDCALDQGREVYAVPGRITDRTCRGTNDLIRQGAGIIYDVETFVDEFITNYEISTGFTVRAGGEMRKQEYAENINEAEKAIICAVDDNSFSVDYASNLTGYSSSEIIVTCMSLCTKKLMQNVGAGRFRTLPAASKLKSILQGEANNEEDDECEQ